jgi:hypothetical protein
MAAKYLGSRFVSLTANGRKILISGILVGFLVFKKKWHIQGT